MNPENLNTANENKTKALLTKIKRSRFQRTDSISSEQNDDPSQKIPLSSVLKTSQKDKQVSNSNTKLNAMYPKTLLSPVKYSIINRQVSEPTNELPNEGNFFKSSAEIVQGKKKKLIDSQNVSNLQIQKSNSVPDKKSAPSAVKRCNKKKGRKKESLGNHDQKEENYSQTKYDKIEIENNCNTDMQSESYHENALISKREVENETKDCIQKDPENDNHFNDENLITLNVKQIVNPRPVDLQIYRTMSACTPSSNSTSIVNRTVNYLLKKRKTYYGDDHQICRTTSKMISSNLPKTPFEYVTSRPAPILTRYHNYQHSNKLLKSSSKKIVCSHSDDEAHDIYETIKSRMKFVSYRNDISNVNDDQDNRIIELNFEAKSEKKDVSNSDPNEKENETKSKIKPKQKHYYGENSTSEIMNFLKNRIDWNYPHGNKKENEKNNFELKNDHKKTTNVKDSKNTVPLSLSKETIVQQTSDILKKFEKTRSNSDFKENSDGINTEIFGKETRKQQYVPPYFRESQNTKNPDESDNNTNKPRKKKINNILDAKELSQIQDVTRQYGIFDEVFLPFKFKTKKKTSSDEVDKMIDSDNFDGYFDLNDDDFDPFSS